MRALRVNAALLIQKVIDGFAVKQHNDSSWAELERKDPTVLLTPFF